MPIVGYASRRKLEPEGRKIEYKKALRSCCYFDVEEVYEYPDSKLTSVLAYV